MRWPGSHAVVLISCINLVITKYELKSKYVRVTQLWPLTVNCQSEFSVLSGRFIIKLLKICFLCTNVDSMIIQQRFNALLQIHYKIVLLFFPLFSKFFTNILKIYELPEIYNKKILGMIFFKICSAQRVLYLLHQILSPFSTINLNLFWRF